MCSSTPSNNNHMTDGWGLQPPTMPPAGWYPDPYDPSGQRYWNGREWDMSTPVRGSYGHHGGDEYPDVGDWLDRSFRIAYRRWRAVAMISLLTTPILTIAGIIAIDRLADGLVISEDRVDGWTNDRLAVAVPLLFVAILFSAIGGIALTSLMLRAVDDDQRETRTFASEFRAARRALWAGVTTLPRAVGWALVAVAAALLGVLVLILVVAALGDLTILVILVLFPLMVWLALRWAFVVTAIVDGPGNPFSRSTTVVRGRWWSTLGRLLLIGIVMWLVSVVIQSIGGLISGQGANPFGGGGAEFQFGDDGSFETIVLDDELAFDAWTIAVGIVVSMVGTVLASSVSAAAMAILYRTRQHHPT